MRLENCMKKLLILFSIILITFMISCSGQDYYEKMTALDPPEQHNVNFVSDPVWITHEMVLNDNEILYYAPRSMSHDNQFYMNEQEQYYIYTIESDIFWLTQYEIATEDDLKEIFD